MNRKYLFLGRKPKIPNVNGLLNRSFVEKHIGSKDVQRNQLCSLEGGYITPWVECKMKYYDSYINHIYLKTTIALDSIYEEAQSLLTEFSLLSKPQTPLTCINSEEAERQTARAATIDNLREKRKQEILTRITTIKTECEMVDEALQHHVEKAEDILHSHISSYWRGVLKASSGEMSHFPFLTQKIYPGRQKYDRNRNDLLSMIQNTLAKGGI